MKDCEDEECINYSDSVIDLGVYKIENNYLDNFLLKNENSNENMFVIVEDGNEKFDKQEDNKMMNKLRINLLTLHYQHQTAFNLIEKPWNGFCAPEAFYDMYDANDKRKNDTWFIGPVRDPISNEILKDENIGFFKSNHFILISSPIIFFFGLSILFGFNSMKLIKTIVFGNVTLYRFIIIFVNIIYYSLLNIYIIKEKRDYA